MLNNLSNLNIKGKTVIIRVDYNVPLDSDFKIVDDTRIIQSLPTILYCLKEEAKVILISHLGRPGGEDLRYSLRPIHEYLVKTLPSSRVHFFCDSIYNAKSFIDSCVKQGEICLLENIRFYPEEESCSEAFSHLLASLGDVFINDAFSVSHRKHASIYGVSKYLPSCAGFLLFNEVKHIDDFLNIAESPKMCIIGGAKVSTKLPLVKNLLDKVDIIVCGGGIGCYFAKVKYGFSSENLDESYFSEVRNVLQKAEEKGVNIIIPSDFCGLINNEISFFDVSDCDLEKKYIYDIGPETVKNICSEIKKCKTVLWNGPVGKFEEEPFEYGTKAIAETIVSSTADGFIKSIVGGGDTIAAINKFVGTQGISYASTSGGAFLEYLEGKSLPGIIAVSI